MKNQEFIGGHKGLIISCQYKFTVRFNRGEEIPNGPKEGYRYDGLYYVEKYENLTGVEGYKMCRSHLRSNQKLFNLENSLVNTFKEDYVSPKGENKN